jgi:hypothetical protein
LMITVDNQEKIEAIIDPGSQIIAMSDAVCHNCGLQYDPTIQLNMQLANGEIDRSLGLSRNVPCRFGDIILYADPRPLMPSLQYSNGSTIRRSNRKFHKELQKQRPDNHDRRS